MTANAEIIIYTDVASEMVSTYSLFILQVELH